MDITKRDVKVLLEKINKAPSTKQHAFVAILTMMNWCVRHELIDVSPLPPMTFKTNSRSRILTDEELKIVWNRAVEVGYPFGTIVQLLILTGQRRGEVAALRRAWIDGDEMFFPGEFTKNGNEHQIPLGAMAKDIIDTVSGDQDLFFPARGKSDTIISGWSKLKPAFDKPINVFGYTLHDLRRTYSSNMAKLGVPIHITERLLNHSSGAISGVAAVYNRYDYADEMMEAVKSYENEIKIIVNQ